jgi:hypothetical protein
VNIIPAAIVAISLLLVGSVLFRGRRRRCQHQRTRLHQIEYGGGYIETCRDCGHQKYTNR